MTDIRTLLNTEATTFKDLYKAIMDFLSDSAKYSLLTKDEIDLLYQKMNVLIRYMNDPDFAIGKFEDFVLYAEDKTITIGKLVVTTSTGKVFDGDETSQDRMLRAIGIADITGQVETKWKLADNTIVTVPLSELKEALSISGQEMSRIWLEQ